MNNLTDVEINKLLALAIGYKPKQIRIEKRTVLVWNKQTIPGFEFIGWHKFDYRDPTVIWPIAEQFNVFPAKWQNEWNAGGGWQDTAAKAVAIAVIKSKEVK